MDIPDLSGNLKALLLEKFEWYEKKLLDELSKQGGPLLTTAQSRTLAVLKGGSCSIADIARRLGVSRQAAHKTVARLIDLGWLTLKQSEKKNEKIVEFTPHGQEMRKITGKSMAKIEQQLAKKLGDQNFSQLVALLNTDWD